MQKMNQMSIILMYAVLGSVLKTPTYLNREQIQSFDGATVIILTVIFNVDKEEDSIFATVAW